MAAIDLACTFLIENEWYWRITENASTFTAAAAACDFLQPLARVAGSRFELAAIAPSADDRSVTFRIGEHSCAIVLANGGDRAVANALVADVNRALATAKQSYAFALIVPRRYELRGALLPEAQLGAMIGDPVMMIPTTRTSARSL